MPEKRVLGRQLRQLDPPARLAGGEVRFDAAIDPALDITTLKAFLTPHPSGAYALCAPVSPADADEVGPEDVVRVLELLAHEGLVHREQGRGR